MGLALPLVVAVAMVVGLREYTSRLADALGHAGGQMNDAVRARDVEVRPAPDGAVVRLDGAVVARISGVLQSRAKDGGSWSPLYLASEADTVALRAVLANPGAWIARRAEPPSVPATTLTLVPASAGDVRDVGWLTLDTVSVRVTGDP